MNDTGEPTLPPGEDADSSAGQQTLPVQTTQQTPPSQLEFERMQLLTRFLVGALAYGGDGLSGRLQDLQRAYETGSELPVYDDSLEGESSAALVRYTTIGLLLRGQKGVARSVRTGYYASLGAASWVAQKFGGATNNGLARPILRPIQARLRRLTRQVDLLAREGKLETQQGRRLTSDAISEIADDLVDLVAESPELTRYIKDVLGGQGAGLATTVGGNARQLTASGDYVIEGVVRRILRRTSRRELPPSPLAGRPQTMYSPETQNWGQENHDE